MILRVVPMGKPRMTRQDAWKKRKPVTQYHAFKDVVRMQVNQNAEMRRLIDSGMVVVVSWTAYLPMPASWSEKKQREMAGCLHQAKPDRDNIDKALLDALFKDDSGIAAGTLVKRWDDGAGVRMEVMVSDNGFSEPPGGGRSE